MGYYNSDLSRFIGEQCGKVMTSIDVDILQVKSARNIIRFIESKHISEKLGDQQEKALKTLAWIARRINKGDAEFNGKRMEVYLVRGNEPYNQIEVYDYVRFKWYKLNERNKIRKFLEVEYDLADSDLKERVEHEEMRQNGQANFHF